MAERATVGPKVMAYLLDMTERGVQKLASEGVAVKAGRGQYDLVESVHNYCVYRNQMQRGPGGDVENLEDWGGARTRRMVAQAELAELEAAKEAGALLPVEIVAAGWGRMVEAARARFLNLPNQLAPVVTSETNYGRNRKTITKAIAEALREVADYSLGVDSRGRTIVQGVSSARPTDRKRVGRKKPDIKRGRQRRAG